MSTAEPGLAAGQSFSIGPARGPRRRGALRRADFRWGIAFAAPYAAVFFLFVAYPFAYALWLAGRPSLFAELITEPFYLPTLINTLVFVGVGVNAQMLLALLLSGFFLRRRWWIRALLAVFVLPWGLAAAQTSVAIHWMLIGRWGLVDLLLERLLGIDGPGWLDYRWLALGADIASYVWRWMPFWTVILLARRLTIPQEIYDAAEVEGATGLHRFLHVTWPLLANLYLVCSLLSALWAFGEFTSVYLVSSGGPGGSTEVLATLGFRYAFELARPELAVAAVMFVLPLLIAIVILLMRRVRLDEAWQ